MSLRESETDLKDMIGILREMFSRLSQRLIRSELAGRRDTTRIGKCLIHCYLYFVSHNLFLLLTFFGFSYRMKGNKAKLLKEAERELEQNITLVKAPSVLTQDQSLTLPKIKVQVSQQQAEENRPMEE